MQIIEFPGITKNDIDPDKVLNEAVGKLDQVLVLGITKDGYEFAAASNGFAPGNLWLVERFKLQILEADYE